ncbi:hypothetical protein J6590_076963 [Homalodisca vitripennis]|nr:hypothetical protein J6590_076963 [Homalodisca vitripennis]
MTSVPRVPKVSRSSRCPSVVRLRLRCSEPQVITGKWNPLAAEPRNLLPMSLRPVNTYSPVRSTYGPTHS